MLGIRLPRLGEIAHEREVIGAGRLVGETVAQEPVVDEAGELKRPHRLGQARVDHRWVPGRGPRHGPAPLGGLGARGDPVGIGRRGLGGDGSPSRARHEGGGAEAASHTLQESTAIDRRVVRRSAMVGTGHLSLSFWVGHAPGRHVDEGKSAATVPQGRRQVKEGGVNARADAARSGRGLWRRASRSVSVRQGPVACGGLDKTSRRGYKCATIYHLRRAVAHKEVRLHRPGSRATSDLPSSRREALDENDRSTCPDPTSIPQHLGRRHRRHGFVARPRPGSGLRPEA